MSSPRRSSDGWLPQGVPEMGMEKAIAFIREERERSRPGEPIELGMNSPWLYIGDPPFDLGPNSLSGSAETIAAALREKRALGIVHMGVRFRSRSCDELIEQVERFGHDVGPLLDS
jgi:hypothetical protein